MRNEIETWRQQMMADGERGKVRVEDIASKIQALKPPTLAEIKDQETPLRPWFFESIIPAGAFLFVGRSKVGKSWLLMQLILCAAKCAKFLDWECFGEFGCLYIASEDDAARIKSRVQQFGVDEFPANVEVMTRTELAAYAKQFAPFLTLAEFLRMYLSQRPHLKVVILDTESTIRMAWNNENPKVEREKSITRKDYAEVSEMDAVAIDLGIFLALVNHTSKRKSAQWLDIHETINRTNTAMAGASGSFVLSDPPDRNPNDSDCRTRVLGIRGRDIRDEYLIAVEQQKGSPFFHSLGPYTLYQQTQIEREILQALADLDADEATPNQWHTARDIAESLGKKHWTVQKAITRMMARGPVLWEQRKVETRKKIGIRFLPEFNK